MRRMRMTLVPVVGVIAVLHRLVPTVRTVLMSMSRVLSMFAFHGFIVMTISTPLRRQLC